MSAWKSMRVSCAAVKESNGWLVRLYIVIAEAYTKERAKSTILNENSICSVLRSPLYIASAMGHGSVVSILLQASAAVDHITLDGPAQVEFRLLRVKFVLFIFFKWLILMDIPRNLNWIKYDNIAEKVPLRWSRVEGMTALYVASVKGAANVVESTLHILLSSWDKKDS